MKIKINKGYEMGINSRHDGGIFEAERTYKGYLLMERAVDCYVVDDAWIARGWAEVVEEITDEDYAQAFIQPWFPQTP
jgi:hypothetical protein